MIFLSCQMRVIIILVYEFVELKKELFGCAGFQIFFGACRIFSSVATCKLLVEACGI